VVTVYKIDIFSMDVGLQVNPIIGLSC